MSIDHLICACGHWWHLHQEGACRTCGCERTQFEDEAAFGKDAWVYCSQHMRPHQTGWCTVSVRDKVGLGVASSEAAYEKCQAWGFPLTKGTDDET